MNAILLTALALGGVNGTSIKAIEMTSHGAVVSGDGVDCYDGGHGAHGGARRHGRALHGRCLGPMPQTCYDPPYGCYPGTRSMNRYPAFHGTYYRRPYNYRNLFDYPWHADLHEPTSLFSHHVTGDTGAGQSLWSEPIPQPPVLVPTPTAALPLHRQIEQSTAGESQIRSQKRLSTLRR